MEIDRVFLDLDDTLLPFDTVFPVWKTILRRRLVPSFRCGLHINGARNLPKKLMVSCFRGMDANDYNKLFYNIADTFCSLVDSSVLTWAEGLVAEKKHIHIVTGSLLPLAQGMARKLGLGECTGTIAEIKGGTLTGRLAGPAVKGRVKISAVKEAFGIDDLQFRNCAAAGDSYGDRFIMEKCQLQFFPKKASKRLLKYFEHQRL